MNQPVGSYNSNLKISLFIRGLNFLRFAGVILLLSCQSDPVKYNIPGGYEYKNYSFDFNYNDSYSMQGTSHTGQSLILYSGIISLSNNVQDTTMLLARILPTSLSAHDICDDVDSISSINIVLTSITQLANEDSSLIIKKDALKIYLISDNHISSSWDESKILPLADITTITNEVSSYTLINDSFIEIDKNSISIKLYDFDENIIDDWCSGANNIPNGVIISYIPETNELEDQDPRYLEFVSSDLTTYTSIKPMVNLEYQKDSIITANKNRYSFSNVESIHETLKPYYINNESVETLWGRIYAINIDSDLDIELQSALDLETVTITEDIISNTQLNSEISLLEITLEINP